MKNSSPEGLFTDGTTTFSPKVDSVPLRDVDSREPGEGSIGDLVSDATAQISSLVRGEVELAKAELAREAKKGAIGGGLFGVAGVIALYSSFFFFFFLATLLSKWMEPWLAYLLVFLGMLVIAGVLALIGWSKVKDIKKPQKTIDSVGELKKLVPGQATEKIEGQRRGLYTDHPVTNRPQQH